MRVLEQTYVFGRPVGSGKVIKSVHFDRKGNTLPPQKLPESRQFISTKEKVQAVVYKAGNKIASLWNIKFKGNRQHSEQRWVGERSEVVTRSAGETEFGNSSETGGTTWVHKFDKRGRKIEEIEYTNTGKIRTRIKHTFDNKGVQVKLEENTVSGTHLVLFDKFGNEKEETWLDLLDEPKRKWLYYYDYY